MSSYQANYPSDWTPLHIAVWRHDFAQTRSLANCRSVNQEDDQGWTPVHLACASEDSMIFYRHQKSRRGSMCGLATSWVGQEKPRRGAIYSYLDDNERATAMGILEILLQHTPNLDHPRLRQSLFLTPLHCAANSGWLSHAKALVEAGASVYTGPDCSPLCWVKGGSDGNDPVALYLREMLGEQGLTMIEDDHGGHEQQRRGAGGENEDKVPSNAVEEDVFRRLDLLGIPDGSSYNDSMAELMMPVLGGSSKCRNVLPRPKPRSISIDSNRLCQTCAGITFKELISPRGYMHWSSSNFLRESARQCELCGIIYSAFNEDRKIDTRDDYQNLDCPQAVHVDPMTIPRKEYPRTFLNAVGPVNHSQKCLLTYTDKVVNITLMVPMELNPDIDSTYDTPWSIQQGLDIDADPLSSSSIKIIKSWLETCNHRHQHCRRDKTSKTAHTSPEEQDVPLPTRVIDVSSPDGESIRLHGGTEQLDRYLALSHRWVGGPMPEWVTTCESCGPRHEWFSFKDLPASIVDAIRVTQKLGIRYLWVDSLCILQDSPGDWESESSRMASVYANAYITLFADCGRDDNHGFLLPRKNFRSTEVVLPTKPGHSVRLNLRKSTATSFKAVQFSLFPTNIETSYLSDRGWIFQERVLSRRILHFGKDQMFWECNEGTFAEDGHVVLRRGLRECGQREGPFSKLAYSAVLDATAPLSRETFASQWVRLVKSYSTLKLTRGEDKLPALSGLAAAFHSHTEEDEYVAGLWRQSLSKQLAWSITNKKPVKAHEAFQGREYKDGSYGGIMETDDSFIHASQLFPRPRGRQVPTFSWASVDGEIEFHDLPKPCVHIESIALVFPAGNRYGNLRSGSLTLSGPFRQAWSCGPLTKDLGGRKEGYIPMYHEGWPFGYMWPDSEDDVNIRDIYCFKLGEKNYPTDIFLVLVPAQETDAIAPAQFRRVGLGQTRENETNFFADAKVEIIEVV